MKAQMKARLRHFELPIGLLTNFHSSQLDFAIVRMNNSA